MKSLETLLTGSPYQAYAYAYPHKSAYRPMPPRPMSEVWGEEDQSALFLYMHVPFCEMRCGFCNLFTMAKPKDELARTYVGALERQARAVRAALGDEARFARMAIGGGTPTQLDIDGLRMLFDIAEDIMGARPQEIPVSCELSPETTTQEKLELLHARGVTRVSIGVQSFLEQETKGARRPQDPEVLDRALRMIDAMDFEVFNLDLIYGLAHQTAESWRRSLERALTYNPEEIYLYPLYVRPLTGLGNSRKSWDDVRLERYREGRAFLLEHGFEQASMRMFRRVGRETTPGPVYCCQADGMVGLGAGARSYTRGLHYSTDYAVGRRGVVSIIEDYVDRTEERFGEVDYGFALDAEEQRRRWAMSYVLSEQGLDLEAYGAHFGTDAREDFPEIAEIERLALGSWDDGVLRLNAHGVERSDVIGPWLGSGRVDALTEEFELR